VRVLLFFLASTSISAAVAQTAPRNGVPIGSRVTIKLPDTDCDSGRFKARLARALQDRGLVITDNDSEAQFVLAATLKVGTRKAEATDVALTVSLKQRQQKTPTTIQTDIKALPDEQIIPETARAVSDNVAGLGSSVHTVALTAPDELRVAIVQDLQQRSISIADDSVHADAVVDVKEKAIKSPHDQDVVDFTFQLTNPRAKRVVAVYSGSKVDPGMYVEPLDIVAGAALEVARQVPILQQLRN
jgi:hypothetical protein